MSRMSGFERGSSEMKADENLLFQSELHPLVSGAPKTLGEFVLSLIHSKAYARAAELADRGVALDLGCNDGYGTMMIAERAANVIGVDVSPSAIQAAKRLRKRDNVDFRLVSGSSLPFPDGTFDLVSSFQVIEHVAAVRPYLEEIRRVLRPGGCALFTTPNRVIRLDPGMAPWNSFHVREYSAQDLGEVLRSVFPFAKVRGLMAPHPLYDIEFSRCQSARNVARSVGGGVKSELITETGGSRMRSVIKASLPQFVLDTLRAIRARLYRDEGPEFMRPLDVGWAQGWTLDDLFYVEDLAEIDRSLDLMAECKL